MLTDSLLWIAIFAVLAVLGAAFAVPSTRPYAKKFWWLGVVVACVLLGTVLLRRRPGSKLDLEVREGKAIAAANLTTLDAIADLAKEHMAEADADLARTRLESEADRVVFDSKLAVVSTIDSSVERRKALIKLVEKQK